MNELDQKIIACFPRLIVRKDLVKGIKSNALVPSYVLEYLLGQECDTSDEANIQAGIKTVKKNLRNHYIQRKEANLMLSNIKEEGCYKVIDKISVTLNDRDDVYEATFSNLGIKKVLVASGTVKEHPILLVNGAWCIADIEYMADKDKKVSPWILSSLQLMQSSGFDFQCHVEARKNFTTDQWIDFLIQSIGLNPATFNKRIKLLLLVRLIPYCERNYNLIELGPKLTGKSHIFSEFSSNGILISGAEVSVAKLFVNNANGKIGLVGYSDVVVFDEFAGKEKKVDKLLVNIMKNYMANKSFSRGTERVEAEASMVFIGNTQQTISFMLQHSNLFDELSPAYHDSAFLDRLHFYLPGWEMNVIREVMFSDGYGFMVDYLAEILRSMRNYDYSDRYKAHFTLSSDISKRDQDGINKTFSGLMKILFPHDGATKEEIEELLNFAIEGRKRVKDHLMRIDPTCDKVTFTYQETTSGKVKFVSTLEEGKFFDAYIKMVVNGAGIREDFSITTSKLPLKEKSIIIFQNESGVSFDCLFGTYLRDASKITISDPNIHRPYQVQNLIEFLGTVMKYKQRKVIVAVHLITKEDKFKGEQQRYYLEEIKDCFGRLYIDFTWEFDSTSVTRARNIVTDTGWKIILGRGLDIFRHLGNNDIFTFSSHLQRYRKCEEFEVVYLKNDGASLLQKQLSQK